MSNDAQITFNLFCAMEEMNNISSYAAKKHNKYLQRRSRSVNAILIDIGKILLHSPEFEAYLNHNPYFKARLAAL